MKSSRQEGIGMSTQVIGKVKSGSGKTYEVKWDHDSRAVYVSYAGWSNAGTAATAGDAMRVAEAWLYDK